MQVRPTSDRLRETLFNVLAPGIEEARFLDLCSGSGAVGIEALSRGAVHATFVDRSRRMCGLIESNLDLCGVPEDETDIVQAEASDFLGQAVRRKLRPWDIVFFDPPYSNDYLAVLELLGARTSEYLGEEGLLVVEHYHKNKLAEATGNLHCYRTLKQGDSALSFYQRA